MSEMESHDWKKNKSILKNMLSLTSSEENHEESNFPDKFDKIFQNSFTADREKQNEGQMQRFVSQRHHRRYHSNKELLCYSAETKVANARHSSLFKYPCCEDLPQGSLNFKPESDTKIQSCKKSDANESEVAVSSKLVESSAVMDQHIVSYGNNNCRENQRGVLTCNDVKWKPLPANSDDLYLALSQAKKDMTCRFDMFMQKCHQLESDVENLLNEINGDVSPPQAEPKSIAGENVAISCDEEVETNNSPAVASGREIVERVVVEDHTSGNRRQRLSYFLAIQNGNLSFWDDTPKLPVSFLGKRSLKSETSDLLLDKELDGVAKQRPEPVKMSILKRRLPSKNSVSVKTFTEKVRCVPQNDSKDEVDVFPETMEGMNTSLISVNKMSVKDASTQTMSSEMNGLNFFESVGPDIQGSGELSRSPNLQWKRQILKRSSADKHVQNRVDLPTCERLVIHSNLEAVTVASEISSQHEGQVGRTCEDKIAGSEASESLSPRPKQRKNILNMLFSCWPWKKLKRRR